MREERENKKTTSIARRINVSFWFKRFFSLLGLDVVIAALLVLTFMVWRADCICGDVWGDWPDIIWAWNGNSYQTLEIIASFGDVSQSYMVHDFFDYALIPSAVLLCVELFQLLAACFDTRGIRRKLRPLNDLAVRAEAISNLSASEANLEHLERAISSVSVDASDIHISTGDKDLQSIEVALNNLLARMQESRRQQTRFVSDASHELRTPISVIQGYVNMLDRWGKENPEVLEESIEALKAESEHMKELIEQLLFLARGDSGRNTLKPAPFDLNDMMREVYEESMMIDSEHVYAFSEHPGICVYGDVAMIKQSVRIFVQNAAKYSKKGDTITLSVGMEANRAFYQVQDEGIGMQSADVVHIFERFYRSDEARNGQTGGSGLGLSIAKWIVDAHDGKIDVLSRQDFGTRFRVSFPCDNETSVIEYL